MRDHTKLRAFQLADQVALAIYKATRAFPREEGSARLSEAEYLHFLDMAYGSAREVEYQVSLAFRLGFLRESAHQELSALTVETSKVLNGLIRSLRRQ